MVRCDSIHCNTAMCYITLHLITLNCTTLLYSTLRHSALHLPTLLLVSILRLKGNYSEWDVMKSIGLQCIWLRQMLPSVALHSISVIYNELGIVTLCFQRVISSHIALWDSSTRATKVCLTCSHLHVVQFAFNQEEIEHICEHESHYNYQHDRKYSREELLEYANCVHLVEVGEGWSHENVVVHVVRFKGCYCGGVEVRGHVAVANGRGFLPVQPVTALDAAFS